MRAALAFAAVAGCASAPRVHGAYADVSGLHMYYEEAGTGRPLVLIHGGGSTAETSFGRILPLLAAHHRVIAPEEQGHGHTPELDRPLSFEQMADDTDALLDRLGVREADVLGFSNGGMVALQLAIRHPARVHKLICSSFSRTPSSRCSPTRSTAPTSAPPKERSPAARCPASPR